MEMPRGKRKNRFQGFRNLCFEYIKKNGPTHCSALISSIDYSRVPTVRELSQLLRRDERFNSRRVNSPYSVLEWYTK
jgi:hypothetical protein